MHMTTSIAFGDPLSFYAKRKRGKKSANITIRRGISVATTLVPLCRCFASTCAVARLQYVHRALFLHRPRRTSAVLYKRPIGKTGFSTNHQPIPCGERRATV